MNTSDFCIYCLFNLHHKQLTGYLSSYYLFYFFIIIFSWNSSFLLPQLTFHTPSARITFGPRSDVSSLAGSMTVLMILCLICGRIQQNRLLTGKGQKISVLLERVQRFRKYHFPSSFFSWPRLHRSLLRTFTDSLNKMFRGEINHVVCVRFFGFVAAWRVKKPQSRFY